MASLHSTSGAANRHGSTWGRFKSLVEAAAIRIGVDDIVRPGWRKVRAAVNRRYRRVVRGEAQVAAFIQKVCRPESNCVDVGCNKGHVLRCILEAAPRGRHVAFEPIPELAEYLRCRFSARPVTVYQMALSDHSGESNFYCVEGDHGRSGLTKQHYPRKNESVHEVAVTLGTLDEILPSGTRVDFIKIDCEGHDLFVIRGAARVIAENRPVILFEHVKNLEKAFGVTSDMIYDEFAQHSMHLARLPQWLDGPAPLTRTQFVEGKGGNIVAWPAETAALAVSESPPGARES